MNIDEPILFYSIIMGHQVDASATYVGVSQFGYVEQHFLSKFFTKLFGTALILFPLKFLSVSLVLLLIDRYIEDEEATLKGTIKLAMLILGLAPGLRDLFRLTMLT